jgi:type IV pilus assembly protein PilP
MNSRWLSSVSILALALSGCASDLDELQTWADGERKAAKPSVKPIEAPKRFVPQAYEAMAAVDPFSGQKLVVAGKQEAVQPNSLLTAELARRREPLEAFPLDGMSMVGSMSRKDGRYAVLKVDNLLYYVKRGDYIGQNFGLIKKIDESEITLRELVQDSTGDWVERTSTLQLQEAAR